jgi:hypothetical protein
LAADHSGIGTIFIPLRDLVAFAAHEARLMEKHRVSGFVTACLGDLPDEPFARFAKATTEESQPPALRIVGDDDCSPPSMTATTELRPQSMPMILPHACYLASRRLRTRKG